MFSHVEQLRAEGIARWKSFGFASLNSTISRTWQKLQTSEKKSLTHVSVVESLESLSLAKNDQSPGARVFMGVKVYGSQL